MARSRSGTLRRLGTMRLREKQAEITIDVQCAIRFMAEREAAINTGNT
jgi:hypothetical protein